MFSNSSRLMTGLSFSNHSFDYKWFTVTSTSIQLKRTFTTESNPLVLEQLAYVFVLTSVF